MHIVWKKTSKDFFRKTEILCHFHPTLQVIAPEKKVFKFSYFFLYLNIIFLTYMLIFLILDFSVLYIILLTSHYGSTYFLIDLET